ncbi:PQQ-binding-like beta-propeller repeat protein [bacterium]|nr:PQQ-binding-like beta-propeller repeat protein [bacterium]
MKSFTRTIPFLAIIFGVIASGLPADAGAYLYSSNRKQINCGIVRLSSYKINQATELGSGYGTSGYLLGNGVGELFYLLDNLTSMKPAGWTLENPFAGSTAASSGSARKYTKSEVDYWFVDLASTRDLSRMQILYLPAHGVVIMDDDDREKLRRFVDGGGVLWVDNSAVSSVLTFDDSASAGFIISDFEFSSALGTDYIDVRHHPLLTIPYWLTDQDVSILGSNAGQYCVWPGYDSSSGVPDDFDYLFPVVRNTGIGNPPVIASNAYGGGYIVATADYVGRGCYMNYPYCLPSLKFAYNLIALSSSWTNARKSPRHSGSSIDTVGGTELAKIWSCPFSSEDEVESAPVIYKNIVYYSRGDTLYAYDLKPQEDLDGDGDIDDGEDDMPNDTGCDLIWKKPCSGTLSSPVAVTMQDPSKYNSPGDSVDAVMVASTDGTVYVLDTSPTNAGKSLLYSEIDWDTGSTCEKPFPPVFVDGWIYVAGKSTDATQSVHIYGFNPVMHYYRSGSDTYKSEWLREFPSSSSSILYTGGILKSGLCFGYASSNGSGALTGMLYWSTNRPTSGSTVTSQNDIVFGLPLVIKNDTLQTKKIVGSQVDCQINIKSVKIKNISNIWIKNYGTSDLQISGNPVKNATISSPSEDTADGRILCNLSGSAINQNGGEVPGDVIICADYSLDYATAGTGGFVRAPQQIKLPLEPDVSTTGSSSLPKTEATATTALGRNAMVYINGERDPVELKSLNSGGSVYGLQIDASAQTNRWNYFLHAGVARSTLENASGYSTSESSNITSPISGLVLPGVVMKKTGSGWLPLQNPQPLSNPACSGDKVFVTVSGYFGSGSSSDYNGGALLCFKANPDFVIRITENAGYDSEGNPIRKAKSLYNSTTGGKRVVSIWQPNLLDDSPLDFLSGQVGVPASMIDYDKGTITIDNFSTLKLKSSSSVTPNTLSPSLPVWVMVDNVEIPVDFSTWGPLGAYMSTAPTGKMSDSVDLSGWNNLLWYYPVDEPIHSSPVVIGDVVYFMDDKGTIYAINTETGETLGKPIDDDQVIWKEPSTSTSTSKTNFSIAGSNGVLVIPKSDGLYAYSNTTTLVADTNRVMELDGAGELSWAADSITWPAHIPPSLNTKPATTSGPINKPSRVRYISSGELLLTNSGANQVCRIDKSAQVGSMRVEATNVTDDYVYIRWMYDRFSDPKRLLRPGQPTSLNGPTDAILWQETETDGSGDTYQVIHCLVADSGNHRIVDLVYKFRYASNEYVLESNDSDIDPASGFCLPRLNWVTTTDTTNQNYVFDCLQLISGTSGGSTTTDIWAAISNYRTGTGSTATTQGLGGAVVGIRYRVANGNSWDYAKDDSGQIIYGCDKMDFSNVGGLSSAPLASPRYFYVRDDASSGNRYLYVCDNYGVYDAIVPSDPSILPKVAAILTDDSYRSNLDRDDETAGVQALSVPLRASCIHVLPSGNWLITNSYSGESTDGVSRFSGEVFEYNPTTTTSGKVEWCSPKIEFSASTGTWKQTIDNGQIMQQPSCAYRQF